MANTNDLQETCELNIVVPAGYEIDKEHSTFERIKFKKKISEHPRWRDNTEVLVEGYYLSGEGVEKASNKGICANEPSGSGRRFFATEKTAKSALAMAQISQIMANDERFGGVCTDSEWNDVTMIKRCIIRCGKRLIAYDSELNYQFLAFHTEEQRELFIEENEDLVKDYLMID